MTDFITALTSDNDTALALVPGATPQIIGAGASALSDTYSTAFRNVWVSAVGFVALAAIGMSTDILHFTGHQTLTKVFSQRPASFSIHAKSSTTILTHLWRRKRNYTLRKKLSKSVKCLWISCQGTSVPR